MISLRCVVFFMFYGVLSQENPCPKVLTMDIADGNHTNNSIVEDGIVFDKNNYSFHEEENSTRECICNIKPCIRLCAEVNETLKIEIYDGINLTNGRRLNHYFIQNINCKYGLVAKLLDPGNPKETFYVQANGSLYVPGDDIKTMRAPKDYCIKAVSEDMNIKNNVMVNLCVLAEESMPEGFVDHETIALITSIPFFFVTFIVYAILPDRTLHMKALMFYVMNLMFAYISIILLHKTTLCVLLGYSSLFFFLGAFFWSNVICIDIWLTFSGLRGFSGRRYLTERNGFFKYCAYAYGVPTLHVLGVYAVAQLGDETSWYYPGFGNGECFLANGIPELIYFRLPSAIIIIVNIILFVITANTIRSDKRTSTVLKRQGSRRHSNTKDKQTFNLYLKLLFAMGINWSMEIISWTVVTVWPDTVPEWLLYVTDFCNLTYGVFIFFIFVFKKNIWKLLKKRYLSIEKHFKTENQDTRAAFSTTNSSSHDPTSHRLTTTSTMTN